jgi:outer membrane protein TolC
VFVHAGIKRRSGGGATLLKRRPDVRQAERRLAAATIASASPPAIDVFLALSGSWESGRTQGPNSGKP